MGATEKGILIFCENVRLIREKNNISQKDMAKIMGIGVASLKKIESGVIPNRVSASAILNLATYFNIKPYKIFTALE